MVVEALYRDQHRMLLLLPEAVTLRETVEAARSAYDRAPVKHLRILPEKPRDAA